MKSPGLARLVFTTSRLAEFCSEKELVNQTGHDSDDWPLVVLKELIDNALDACEEADAAPVIHVAVSDSEIAVFDNGLGIAPETVAVILDYNTRTSSREAYVSPTRGAQGNALKTLLAMPFAPDGERGETTIESQGVAHPITFSIDPIRQEPRIVRICEGSLVKTGTRIAVSWPISASSILDYALADFLRIAKDYSWINPHFAMTVKWDRDGCDPVQWTILATDPNWRKWRPSDPTSPHWYDEARLARLIPNTIAYSEDRKEPCPTVWAFVRQFRGLSGTAKAICEAAGAGRMSLTQFYGDGEAGRASALLDAMRKQSRLIKPRDLGIIGEAHLRAKFESAGAAPESFNYKKSEIEHDGVPYLAEAAFGYCPKGINERRIITGVNVPGHQRRSVPASRRSRAKPRLDFNQAAGWPRRADHHRPASGLPAHRIFGSRQIEREFAVMSSSSPAKAIADLI
jgi:DNA topoisomerase VI subunit B